MTTTTTHPCPAWCQQHDTYEDDCDRCGTIPRLVLTPPLIKSVDGGIARTAGGPITIELFRWEMDGTKVDPTLVELELPRTSTQLTPSETRALAQALLEAADQAEAG